MLLKLLQHLKKTSFEHKKWMLFPLFLCALNTSISAQSCLPDASVCSEAIAMCDQFISVATPTANNNSGPIPGCGGAFSYENTSWYVFTALTQQVSITLSARTCDNGRGFQAAVYAECDINGNAMPLGLQCACTNRVTFDMQVTPFQQYYIMLDGCSGDICDVDIIVSRGEIFECFVPPIDAPDAPTPSNNPVCPGLVVELSTNLVAGAEFYNWTFPAGVFPLSIDCNKATVLWGLTPGNVTVTASSVSDPIGQTSDPTWVNLTEPIGYDTVSYCFPEEQGWYYAENDTTYFEGSYAITLENRSSLGCDSIVFLEVNEILTAPGIINQGLCAGDSVEINGIVYNDTGGYEQNFPGGSSLGCDSTVFIFLFRDEFEILNATSTDVGCGSCNGTLSFDISCGFAPFSIEWSNGLASGQTQFDSLCAGTYTVTVADAIGDTLVETFVIAGGPGLTIASSSQDITCFGASDGSIDTDVQGGSGGFIYDWSDDSLDGEEDPTGLDAGTYELTVTDAEGCSGTLVVTIEEPDELTLELEAFDVTCTALGSITSSVSGGTGNYTYLWNTGATTPNLSDLDIGYYLLVVTDENGCANERDVVINTPLILNGMPVNTFESGLQAFDTLNCGEQSIILEANPYDSTSFTWTTNDGNIIRTQGNRMELDEGGTYYLEMQIEVNGVVVCSLLDSVVIEKECCPVAFYVESTDETCLGINDGTATVVIDGPGLPPYTIEWSDPNLPNESTVIDLAPGSYTVTLTDAAGCSDEVDFEIAAYLEINLTTTPADCDGTGGSATISGGGFFVFYSWSNSGSGNTQTNLDVGEYTVTAWSIFGGCQSQLTFNIELDSSCNDAADFEQATLEQAFEEQAEEQSLELPGIDIRSNVQVTSQTELTVFPNPVTQSGTISVELPIATQAHLSLLNVRGETVRTLIEKLPAGHHQFDWDLSNLPKGIYYVRLQTSAGEMNVAKWIKL